MSADARAWGWAVAVVALALAAGLGFDGRASLVPPHLDPPALGGALADAGSACPTWTLVAGRGEVRGAEAVLVTDGVLRLDPCPDRAADVALRGTPVAGVGAWAVASDAQGVAFAGHVGAEGVALSAASPLLVSFSNDLARGDEDRNLYAIAR